MWRAADEENTASDLSYVCSFKKILGYSISPHLQGRVYFSTPLIQSNLFAELPAKILQAFRAELKQKVLLWVHIKRIETWSGEMDAKQLEGWKPTSFSNGSSPAVVLVLGIATVPFSSCFQLANARSV